MGEKREKLGGREVQLYERDRIPHATERFKDHIHVHAELHRGRYAGDFYQKRQSGPGMETGVLRVAAKDLKNFGENLRIYAFIQSFQMGEDPVRGGFTYHIVFHPNDKAALMKMIHDRIGSNFAYTMTSAPIFPQSQREIKLTKRSLPKCKPISKDIKTLDSVLVCILCRAIRENRLSIIQAKIDELGMKIVNIPIAANGMTLLHYAAQQSNLAASRLLLKFGALREAELSDGRKPIDFVNMSKEQQEDQIKAMKKLLVVVQANKKAFRGFPKQQKITEKGIRNSLSILNQSTLESKELQQESPIIYWGDGSEKPNQFMPKLTSHKFDGWVTQKFRGFPSYVNQAAKYDSVKESKQRLQKLAAIHARQKHAQQFFQ